MIQNKGRLLDSLFDVSGKVYLIAGGGGGFGSVIAKALYARGVNLVLFDTNKSALERIRVDIPDAIVLLGDITDEESISKIVDLTCKHFGRIDGAINAAGVLPISPAATFDEAVFSECQNINVTGAFLFSRSVAKAMPDEGGRIIHLASVSSLVANAEYSAYASSKAALVQLIRVLAKEWAPRNTLVNAIGPALTETSLTHDYLLDTVFHDKAISSIPLGRLGRSEDLIGAILLLMAPAGEFITGQTIYVDGGRTLV